MGIYNGKHLLHYVCIECRIGSKSMQKSLKCPECTKQMKEVGVIFRIPKKTDNKGWKNAIDMIKHGKTHSKWWGWLR